MRQCRVPSSAPELLRSSRQICLTKRAAYRPENLIESRQRAHLVGETLGPECFQPCFFLKDGRFESVTCPFLEFKFLADCVCQMIQADALVGCQVPKIE